MQHYGSITNTIHSKYTAHVVSTIKRYIGIAAVFEVGVAIHACIIDE